MPPTIYAGLAGDTDPGRFVSAGLYRCRDGGAWERIDGAFAPKPEVRAIVPDPARAGSLTIATQSGLFRSDDGGDSWSQLAAPAPELAVWSLLVDPTDQETMYAGYEPCAILRTRDAGKTWERLPVTEDYPSITASPEFPKRVTAIAVDPANPVQIYASLEIGGLLRSLDGGGSWEAAIDGVYVVEDAVDLHCVVVSPSQPGVVTITTRVGTFQSLDRGRHWKKLAVPALREKGSYCRALTYAPGRPEHDSTSAPATTSTATKARSLSATTTASGGAKSSSRPDEKHGVRRSGQCTPSRLRLLRDEERWRLRFARRREVVAVCASPGRGGPCLRACDRLMRGPPVANTLKQKLKRDEIVVVVNPDHPSPSLTEFVAGLGFDGIFIDCEHGMATIERVQEMCRAARAAACRRSCGRSMTRRIS